MPYRHLALRSQISRARAFLTPVDNSEVPELREHYVRGTRAGAWLLLLITFPLWLMQLVGGYVDPVRSTLYTFSFAAVFALGVVSLRSKQVRTHAEHAAFTIASAAAAMALFAAWPMRTADNPFSHFAFVFPVAFTAFIPARPSRAILLGLEIGALHAFATLWTPSTYRVPIGEGFAIGLAFGIAGALAAQAQRYVLAELYRARAVAERQAHELAIARDRALEGARLKTQFLANMSHEIRTPMAAILGFTEVIGDELKRHDCSADARDAFDTVQRNGEHLLRLINDILDLSRLEASEVLVERRVCSVNELIADVVRVLGSRAAERQVELRVLSEPEAPRNLLTDPMRLRQIVLNLLENAIKFTERGHVQIELRRVPLESGVALAIEVSDTGLGMTEEQMARIFDPFVQADNSYTRRFGGTGLGLAISRRLAVRLGARLTARSSPGVGSSFTLVIPALDAEVEQLHASSQAADGQRRTAEESGAIELRGRILIAEDGVDNQRLLMRMLRSAGATVELAENGRVAVEMALAAAEREDPYDLILMDMQMPELDGYQATEHLRQAGYTQPIVALTAHAMVGDSQRCLSAGCDGYLSKPVSRPLLLEQASRFMGTHSKRTA